MNRSSNAYEAAGGATPLEAGEQPRVRGSLLGESGVALVVLLVAAMLTNGSPPPLDTGTSTTNVRSDR